MELRKDKKCSLCKNLLSVSSFYCCDSSMLTCFMCSRKRCSKCGCGRVNIISPSLAKTKEEQRKVCSECNTYLLEHKSYNDQKCLKIYCEKCLGISLAKGYADNERVNLNQGSNLMVRLPCRCLVSKDVVENIAGKYCCFCYKTIIYQFIELVDAKYLHFQCYAMMKDAFEHSKDQKLSRDYEEYEPLLMICGSCTRLIDNYSRKIGRRDAGLMICDSCFRHSELQEKLIQSRTRVSRLTVTCSLCENKVYDKQMTQDDVILCEKCKNLGTISEKLIYDLKAERQKIYGSQDKNNSKREYVVHPTEKRTVAECTDCGRLIYKVDDIAYKYKKTLLCSFCLQRKANDPQLLVLQPNQHKVTYESEKPIEFVEHDEQKQQVISPMKLDPLNKITDEKIPQKMLQKVKQNSLNSQQQKPIADEFQIQIVPADIKITKKDNEFKDTPKDNSQQSTQFNDTHKMNSPIVQSWTESNGDSLPPRINLQICLLNQKEARCVDCGYRIALSVSFFMDEISKSESGRMICYEEVQRANMDPSELITLCMYCYSRQIYMTKEAQRREKQVNNMFKRSKSYQKPVSEKLNLTDFNFAKASREKDMNQSSILSSTMLESSLNSNSRFENEQSLYCIGCKKMVKASSYSKSLMKCADCSFKNMRGEDLVSYTCKTCKKLSKKNDYVFEVSKCQQCHLAWQEKLKREKSGEISRTFRFFCSSCHQLSQHTKELLVPNICAECSKKKDKQTFSHGSPKSTVETCPVCRNILTKQQKTNGKCRICGKLLNGRRP